MKFSRTKVNAIFNILLTISNLIFPMLTFPYVSRVIGAEGIGTVNYVVYLASFFIMLAQAGIQTYGIKAIAQAVNKNIVFNQLFTINFFLGILSTVLFFVSCLFLERFYLDKLLYLVIGMSIFINALTTDWYFSGKENFKYIAMRTTAIRLIFVVLLYNFVRHESDYVIYGALSVLTILISNIYNIMLIMKDFRVKLSPFHELSIHKKPLAAFFGSNIVGSVYLSMDVVLLGFWASDAEIGFYSTNKKIVFILISLIGALNLALIPKLTQYASSGKTSSYDELCNKSLKVSLFVAVPSLIFAIFSSKFILLVFGGSTFVNGFASLQILSIILIVTTLTTFMGNQVLIPKGFENLMLKANVFGALVNIFLNVILIPKYKECAPSFAIVTSELVVFSMQVYYARKILPKINIYFDVLKFFMSGFVGMLLVKFYLYRYSSILASELKNGFMSVCIFGFVYVVVLLLMRDRLIINLFKR